mmetsp:Transcript_4368/g.10997  ORF Transcript_4368/g.10997 Transcript_4368/m.10997 type:complete len:200 (+) Transcript_4368:1-600(+)
MVDPSEVDSANVSSLVEAPIYMCSSIELNLCPPPGEGKSIWSPRRRRRLFPACETKSEIKFKAFLRDGTEMDIQYNGKRGAGFKHRVATRTEASEVIMWQITMHGDDSAWVDFITVTSGSYSPGTKSAHRRRRRNGRPVVKTCQNTGRQYEKRHGRVGGDGYCLSTDPSASMDRSKSCGPTLTIYHDHPDRTDGVYRPR